MILRLQTHSNQADDLLEWVGAGTPPGEEHAETDSLEHAGNNTNGDSVEWALLGDDGGDELGTTLALFSIA